MISRIRTALLWIAAAPMLLIAVMYAPVWLLTREQRPSRKLVEYRSANVSCHDTSRCN